jgi:hypothetical protein
MPECAGSVGNLTGFDLHYSIVLSIVPVYRILVFVVCLSFRLVRNLSESPPRRGAGVGLYSEGFPTRFTCGNDRHFEESGNLYIDTKYLWVNKRERDI